MNKTSYNVERLNKTTMTEHTTRLDHLRLERVADVLKVIAHPVRLEILEILENYPGSSVTDIQERLSGEVEQSALSHHLIKLKDRGVIQCSRSGVFMQYSLVDNKLMNLFSCMSNCDIIR